LLLLAAHVIEVSDDTLMHTSPDLTVQRLYRAMHYSAKRGIAIACRPSVCPSICLSVTLVPWWIRTT